MAGGTWTIQNKVLPGVYINFFSKASTLVTMGERGVVCISKVLDWGPIEEVIEITDPAECFSKLGYDQTSSKLRWLQQMLLGTNRTSGASKVYIWGLKTTDAVKATGTETDDGNTLAATAKYFGVRGNDLSIVVSADPDNNSSHVKFYVQTLLQGEVVDSQTLEASAATVALSGLVDNDWVSFTTKTGNAFATAGISLTGGSNGTTIASTGFTDFMNAAELLTFNIIICQSSDPTLKQSFSNFVKRLTNDEGKKCQLVVSDYPSADSECVISVYPQTITPMEGSDLTTEEVLCWVAGASAGANVDESLTYTSHPDAVGISPILTTQQQATALQAGQLVFVQQFDKVQVLQDINSFTGFTVTKGKQFRKNRVIRVLFDFANSIYKTYSLYYIGQTDNNEVGRDFLKAEIISLLNMYEGMGAMQNVNADDVTVLPGEESDAVVIECYIQPVDAIEKIYMNVTIS